MRPQASGVSVPSIGAMTEVPGQKPDSQSAEY